MPQPLSKKRPDATSISFTADALQGKPEFAIIATVIIATSAIIDHELRKLFVKLVGARAAAALAVYDVLDSQRLQHIAMRAAAKAVLPSDQFNVFRAVISTADGAQSERHKLAHWIWCLCPDLPDALLLANPAYLHERDREQEKLTADPRSFDPVVHERLFRTNLDEILVYEKGDLEGARRDIVEVHSILFWYKMYVSPPITEAFAVQHGLDPQGNGTRARALDQLSQLRLFREALGRIEAVAANSTPQSQS